MPPTSNVHYYNKYGDLLGNQHHGLEAHQLRAFNVRDYEALDVDDKGYAEGFIRIDSVNCGASQCEPISVDAFQVDAEVYFATGGLAHSFERTSLNSYHCSEWQARFLKFPGSDQGSKVKVWVENPWGAEREDPPTAYGDIYSEDGSYIHSFVIRTDQWTFEIDPLEYVEGSTSFGSVELLLSLDDFGGGFEVPPTTSIVMAEHSAHVRFSIGAFAVFTDLRVWG